MTDTGFHVPMVQPEFLEPNGGCYALILNNDNGSSRDEGETVWYAGSGGRHRGQNRTAKQVCADCTCQLEEQQDPFRVLGRKGPVRVF